MSVFLTEALRYADAGWLVFPCHPASKVPATAHGFKDATKDPVQIREWWAEEPAYNIAIATGEGSGLFVLDVDKKYERTIDEAVAAFPQKLPDCPTVMTGGGGRQYFFRFPVGSALSISGGRLGLGLDTRGNGGYVVAPPSIHPETKAAYGWIDWNWGDPIPETPQWIIDQLKKQREGAIKLNGERIAGGRHDTLMHTAAQMRSWGMVPAEIFPALKVMVARMDLSDGRVIEDGEIRSITEWAGDKDMGLVNLHHLHGAEVARSIIANGGAAADLMVHEAGISDPGIFPADLLNVPGIVNEWAEYINQTSHRPQPELALAAVLTACGAVIGRRLQSETGGRANIYTLGLCETGGGKERARQGVKEVLTAAGLEDLIGQEDWASESGLVASLVVNPTQLYQVDEIGKMLAAIANPRAGTHLVGITSALLKLYSSANSVYKGKAYADAAKNPVIREPHVCLYGTAVPDQAWEALGAGAVSDGLLARLWVFSASNHTPARQKPVRLEVPTELVASIQKWESSAGGFLARKNSSPPIAKRSEDAEAIAQELIDECDQMEARMGDNPLRKLWTRTAQKADQLSLVHAWSLARGVGPILIGRSSALWASRVAQHLTNAMIWNAHRHVSGSAVETDLKAFLRYLEDAGEAGRTRREICRRFQRLGKRGLDEVLLLATTGEYAAERSDTKAQRGGKTIRFYLSGMAPFDSPDDNASE